MKIKFVKVIANRTRGAVAELDDPTARSLIAAGYAEEYTGPGPEAGPPSGSNPAPPAEPGPQHAGETGDDTAPETDTPRRPRRR